MHGYSNFSLEILVYCKPEDVIKVEQEYIDLLKPEYNILKVAGSSLGYKHTEETLIKLKARTMSSEHRTKLIAHLARLNAREMPSEIRAKISKGMATFNVNTKGKPVLVTNITTQVTTEYVSISEAARNLNASKSTILRHIKRQATYLGVYDIRIKGWGPLPS
jgi:group I intron endonuclease